MKTCTKCKEAKPLDHFTKKSGYCRACRTKDAHVYRRANIEQYREKQKKWRRGRAGEAKTARRKQREEALAGYGSRCNCCGESTYEFLTFDHVNNDGNVHRKMVSSAQFLKWLRDNNYPSSIQVLCYNCNLAKGKHGQCPHNV